jgi:hypothetical protein
LYGTRTGRKVIKGSLKLYPIKGFGAIEMGLHNSITILKRRLLNILNRLSFLEK